MDCTCVALQRGAAFLQWGNQGMLRVGVPGFLGRKQSHNHQAEDTFHPPGMGNYCSAGYFLHHLMMVGHYRLKIQINVKMKV